MSEAREGTLSTAPSDNRQPLFSSRGSKPSEVWQAFLIIAYLCIPAIGAYLAIQFPVALGNPVQDAILYTATFAPPLYLIAWSIRMGFYWGGCSWLKRIASIILWLVVHGVALGAVILLTLSALVNMGMAQ